MADPWDPQGSGSKEAITEENRECLGHTEFRAVLQMLGLLFLQCHLSTNLKSSLDHVS
jgi:hypothetical protein